MRQQSEHAIAKSQRELTLNSTRVGTVEVVRNSQLLFFFFLTLETAKFPDKFVMGPKRKDGLNDGSIFCFVLFVLLEQLGELI